MYKKHSNLSLSHIVFGLAVILTTFSSSAWAAKDNREVIVLNAENRNFVLHEMRQNISGLQKALTALSKDDMKGVAAALRPLGTQSMANVPSTLMSSVPGEFMRLGMPYHMAFDQMADAAEKGASTKEILASLGKVMNRCVACHAAYRIKEK